MRNRRSPWKLASVWACFRLTLVSLGSLALVFGILVVVRDETEPFFSNGALYDPATNTWTAMSGAGAPRGREKAFVRWDGRRFVVWGGRRFAPEETGGAYDVPSGTWSPLEQQPHEAGLPPLPLADVPSIWSPRPQRPAEAPLPPLPPEDFGLKLLLKPFFVGDYVLALEGGVSRRDPDGETHRVYLGIKERTPRLFIRDATKAWAHTQLPAALCSRQSSNDHIWVVPCGANLVFWVGDTGAVYDLGSKTWSAMDFGAMPWTDGAPGTDWLGGRRDERVVATETRLLFFSPRLSGAIYDLETSTWTPMSTQGAPSRRSRPFTVWTGTRLIVWGGELEPLGRITHAQGGGLFDPITNTWSPMPQGPLRAKAGMHSAWSGSLLAVWGGRQDGPSEATSHFPLYQVLHMLLLAVVVFGPEAVRVRGGSSRHRGCLTSIGLLALFGGLSSALIFCMQWQLFDQLRSETLELYGPSWAQTVGFSGVPAFLLACLIGGLVTQLVPRKPATELGKPAVYESPRDTPTPD